MIGELIATARTYDEGRILINSSFSGSASFETFSASTMFSGSTNLYNIFATTDAGDITRVQPGSNITTGGTGNYPVVNLVSSPSVGGFTNSGATSLQSVSATTIISGTTDLYNIFATTNAGDITRVQPGSNITTGGTGNYPVVNLVSSPSVGGFTNSGATSLQSVSATTLNVGGDTYLYGELFSYGGSAFGADVSIQGRLSLQGSYVLGGVYNISQGNNNYNYSDYGAIFGGQDCMLTSAATGSVIAAGNAITGTSPNVLYTTTLSANAVNAGVIMSGGTDLDNLFVSQLGEDKTRVQPGSNITTGGTANNPIISVADYVVLYELAVGLGSNASGTSSFAQGTYSFSYGVGSHAEGTTLSYGVGSHSEGATTETHGYQSHAEGYLTKTYGGYSHAEGEGSIASGQSSHAEGYQTQSSGDTSHSEGLFTISYGQRSHAEGVSSESRGSGSHAEGDTTKSYGGLSHSEGHLTESRGVYSHAEGDYCISSGISSHAEGRNTQANGDYSHTEGGYTITNGLYSLAAGFYNTNNSNYSAMIGGSGNTLSSAAHQSVVIGGQSISGASPNFVYMPEVELVVLGGGIILVSTGGTKWKLTIDDSGNTITTAV